MSRMRCPRRRTLGSLLFLGAVAVFVWWRRRSQEPAVATGSPQWPSFAPEAEPAAKAEPEREAAPEPDPEPHAGVSSEWMPSTSAGVCPAGFPIKANDSSHIFHVPGGRSYERTRPDRCYATAAAAERDGYRQAKA
jgi:hypothetical protein